MTLFSYKSKSLNVKEGVRLKVRDQIEKRRPIFIVQRLNLNKLVRTKDTYKERYVCKRNLERYERDILLFHIRNKRVYKISL